MGSGGEEAQGDGQVELVILETLLRVAVHEHGAEAQGSGVVGSGGIVGGPEGGNLRVGEAEVPGDIVGFRGVRKGEGGLLVPNVVFPIPHGGGGDLAVDDDVHFDAGGEASAADFAHVDMADHVGLVRIRTRDLGHTAVPQVASACGSRRL